MRVSISPQESYGIMAALRRQKRPHRSNTLLWVEWSHLRHKAMKSLWELTHHYSKTRTLSLPSQLRRCRREAACQCCPGQLRGRPILLITWIWSWRMILLLERALPLSVLDLRNNSWERGWGGLRCSHWRAIVLKREYPFCMLPWKIWNSWVFEMPRRSLQLSQSRPKPRCLSPIPSIGKPFVRCNLLVNGTFEDLMPNLFGK